MEEQRGLEVYAVAERATATSVAEILAGERTPRRAVEIAESAGRLLDGLYRPLDQANPPACRAGCAWCCHVRVACTPPEAIAVAAHVQAKLAKRDRRQLVARLEAVGDRYRDVDSREWARRRIPCPFLESGVCLVHPARPLACRGWHSFDVGQCKAHWADPSRRVEASGERLTLRGVVSRALADGLGRGGLIGERVELAAAVRLVLASPSAVAAWLRGEDAFAPVRWTG